MVVLLMSHVPETETIKIEASPTTLLNGNAQNQHDTKPSLLTHGGSVSVRPSTESASPDRPKSPQNQHLTVPIQIFTISRR